MRKIPAGQFRTVLLIEMILIGTIGLIAYSYWNITCDGSIKGCITDEAYSPISFFLLALLRPLFFSPIMVTALVAGGNFGPLWGPLIAALGTACSAMLLYIPGSYLGKRLVAPWLQTNLPNTWALISSQDYKLIFITRWLPIFPFDLLSFLFGVANFNKWRVFVFTFLGILPEIFLFAHFASSPESITIGRAFLYLLTFGVISSVPLLIYESLCRRQGSSLWVRCKRVYYEIFYEVQVNNEIKKKQEFDPDKIPVILIYGFFSSRKTLSVMERLLSLRGYQVMTFNLGGVLGVFFTRGIRETAEFLDRKIRRQLRRHDFKRIYLIGHSKGGLVALWWILRMGGSKYCQHVITMGTPFKGTRLTYLALFTPLGFFWKDVWQMRPGSKFLRELHESPPVENLTIYNLYSRKDSVAHGPKGMFEHSSEVIGIPMNAIAHFEFLYKRSVADTLVKILNSAEEKYAQIEAAQSQNPDRRRRRKKGTDLNDNITQQGNISDSDAS
ncbi:MAG: alpha/beta fold hydrolase [Pseudobacteriovorax sp.]|nr:alpha/beta fold hydrolase [Pseudobacteriovorax sp.]